MIKFKYKISGHPDVMFFSKARTMEDALREYFRSDFYNPRAYHLNIDSVNGHLEVQIIGDSVVLGIMTPEGYDFPTEKPLFRLSNIF